MILINETKRYSKYLIIILLQIDKRFKSLDIKILNYPRYPQVTVQSGTVSEAPYSKILLTCSLGSQSAITLLLLLMLYDYMIFVHKCLHILEVPIIIVFLKFLVPSKVRNIKGIMVT